MNERFTFGETHEADLLGRLSLRGPDGKELVAVVVSCLENVPDSELAALPVMYVDGRNDNFQAPPAETSHL